MNRQKLLKSIQSFSDDQYSTANRLNARIQLYQYCEQDTDWQEWVFDHIDFEGIRTILEIGCGNGVLWQKNLRKVPPEIQITLTDLSYGMVKSAQGSIKDPLGRFKFQIADTEEIPFPDHVFDVLIANHLLFYFQTKDRIFAEIERVLIENGTAYASTVSVNSLQELLNIITKARWERAGMPLGRSWKLC